MSTNTTEREKFEAWAVQEWPGRWPFEKFKTGYLDPAVNGSWLGWQAALAASQADAERLSIARDALEEIALTSSQPVAEAGELPALPHALHSCWSHPVHVVPPSGDPYTVSRSGQHYYTADQMHAYLLADRAARQPVVPAGMWQPIETAPKTGRVLLADDTYVGEGFWEEALEDGVDYMGHDAGFIDANYSHFSCARQFGTKEYRSAGVQPTRWMPLPPAPASASEVKP